MSTHKDRDNDLVAGLNGNHLHDPSYQTDRFHRLTNLIHRLRPGPKPLRRSKDCATTGMPGFKRMFRARRRRNRVRFVREARRPSHINITQTTAAAATDTETLIITPTTIDEDPDHTIISNGTTIAECHENSRITGVDLTLEIAGDSSPDDPFPVSVLVWKDSQHGALGTPGTANDVLVPSTTLQLGELKRSTCQFERFMITGQSDKRRLRIRIPRRLRYIRQGERIAMTITNGAAANTGITWILFGRIWTSH